MDQAHEADPVTIRAQEPEDAAAVSALLGRPGSFEGTLQLPDMPVASRLELLQKVDTHSCKLVAVAGGAIVGAAGLHPAGLSLRRSHARMLGIGIAREWQGRGLGRRLIARLLDWADNWTGVLRVELTVHADNERAIALYRAMGFVEEGRMRGYALKDGRYVDALCMARLHPAPPRLAA
ncbi:GNAT family N-acetyltransferase [Ramlibacter sp. RBP-2]|uniref:GNAT family N-acetyltransferase n=1 Tax=Ramlibacter lithotrophicus TaxID=2606681 RepID=A0A7X6DHU9_9BURK|nr:GNAT family N-acetyltransferase [Ramlibacter lithotrophicus]NKE67438.1 GNAT family N-acetyltransferase [Ramlibacter lithotrophicus]